MTRWLKKLAGRLAGRTSAANIAAGTHDGAKTLRADAPSAQEHLLVAVGSDADHYAIAASGSVPIGTQLGAPAGADEYVAVALLGSASSTRTMVASGAITAGTHVVLDDSGKVKANPGTSGTYTLVGVALSAALADGDLIDVDPCVATPIYYA